MQHPPRSRDSNATPCRRLFMHRPLLLPRLLVFVVVLHSTL